MGEEFKKVFINGRWRTPKSPGMKAILNQKKETIAIVPNCGAEDIQDAISAAKDALGSWLERNYHSIILFRSDMKATDRETIMKNFQEIDDFNADLILRDGSSSDAKPTVLGYIA